MDAQMHPCAMRHRQGQMSNQADRDSRAELDGGTSAATIHNDTSFVDTMKVLIITLKLMYSCNR